MAVLVRSPGLAAGLVPRLAVTGASPEETEGPRVGGSRVLGPRDEAVIAGQLGRQPRDVTGIPVRCPFDYPAVIETAPVLSDGAPNPTLLYLTCPAMVAAVSRVEAGGGVRELKFACGNEERLRAHLNGVTRLYQERRAELAAELTAEPAGDGATIARRAARLEAGIGGPERPEVASCLHAYAAAWLAVMSGWLGGGRNRLWAPTPGGHGRVFCRRRPTAGAPTAVAPVGP